MLPDLIVITTADGRTALHIDAAGRIVAHDAQACREAFEAMGKILPIPS